MIMARYVDLPEAGKSSFLEESLHSLRSRVLVQVMPGVPKRVNISRSIHTSLLDCTDTRVAFLRPFHLFSTQEEARSPCKTQVP